METFWENNDSCAEIITQGQKIEIKCLAFAEHLTFFAD